MGLRAPALHIRAAEAFGGEDRERVERDLYDREFLTSRPLLQALEHRGPMPPVLLIDEVDRSDDEFEAFLLETFGLRRHDTRTRHRQGRTCACGLS